MTLRYKVRHVPLGMSLSGSVSSRIVYELALASPSQIYCLSDFGLFVETTTYKQEGSKLNQSATILYYCEKTVSKFLPLRTYSISN